MAKKIDVENFLLDKHAEQYIGTKHAMVDDSADWIGNLSADEFLEYGDKFAKEQSKDLLEACKRFKTFYMTLCHMNPDSFCTLKQIIPNELINAMEQAIAKTEEGEDEERRND